MSDSLFPVEPNQPADLVQLQAQADADPALNASWTKALQAGWSAMQNYVQPNAVASPPLPGAVQMTPAAIHLPAVLSLTRGVF